MSAILHRTNSLTVMKLPVANPIHHTEHGVRSLAVTQNGTELLLGLRATSLCVRLIFA